MSFASKTLYRSFENQALHCFTRPHTQTPDGPIASPAHWIGAEMRERQPEWCVDLDASQISELSDAADALVKAGVPMGEVTRKSFPLALIVCSAIGVAAGAVLGEHINPRDLNYAAGIDFVVIAAATLRKPSRIKQETANYGLRAER